MLNIFWRIHKLKRLTEFKVNSVAIKAIGTISNVGNHEVNNAENLAPAEDSEKPKKERENSSGSLPDNEIEKLSRDELIAMVNRLQTHNKQLRTIIKGKGTPERDESEVDKLKKQWILDNSHRRRILLKLAYFGWNFQGFAVQVTASNTIEHHLFNALDKLRLIESRQASNYQITGRTDRGVSALEQIISIDVRSRVHPDEQLTQDGIVSELDYCKMLNRAMPQQIKAIAWRPLASSDYNARYDCIDRTYRYFFPRGNLDIDKMNEACTYLVGCHNFQNFSKRNKTKKVAQTREIYSADVKVNALNSDKLCEFDTLCLEIKGRSFLWHMVRKITSVLMMVGQDLERPEIVKELLDPNRTAQLGNALEVPLILFKANFRDDRREGLENNEVLNKWVVKEDSLRLVLKILHDKWSQANARSTLIYQVMKVLRQEYAEKFPEQPTVQFYRGRARVRFQKNPEVQQDTQKVEKVNL